MESFKLAFDCVMPMLLFMALGHFLKKKEFLSEQTIAQTNQITFLVFLPCVIFQNIYHSDLNNAIDRNLCVYALVSVLLIVGVAIALAKWLSPIRNQQGVMIQALFRSNFVLFGMQMSVYLCGPLQSAVTTVLLALVIPLFNLLAVLILSFYTDHKVKKHQVLLRVLKNPLIIACIAGAVLNGLRIVLPLSIERTLGDLSKIATPLALLLLGADFTFSAARHNLRPILIASAGRLLVVPGIFLSFAAYLGFRGIALVSLLTLFGSPVAVSSYTMARQMGGDEELAGQILVFTSIGCIFSLFGFIWLFRFLKLF